MRSRSHRLPRVETHDDWVDESWTVDCLCGVNFDDGEEMVDCDKCSVWVHTRCSGYVKSEKSFVCDKCKGKNSRSSRNNYSAETEVAQLLVDLPNKDFRKERANTINGHSRRPRKGCYTEVCTEKKVHVHGVPGGDPGLFAGLSSVFSPQLWKCTGYVPKKFNFQYKEFPSWDEKEVEEVERRNHNENTAGVLFSLLKDSAPVNHLESYKDVECLVEDGTTGKGANIEHVKSNAENKESSCVKNVVEKDQRLPQAAVVDSLNHKIKDRGPSKDSLERKRSGIHEKGKDSKKKARISSITASTISNDGGQFKFYEDRGPKAVKVYTESSKSGDSKHLGSDKHFSNGPGISTNNDRKHAAADEHDVETKKLDSSRCYTNRDGRLKEDSTGDQREFKIEYYHKVNQVASGTLDSPNINGRGSAQRIRAEFQKAQPEVEHLAVASRKVVDSKKIQGLIGDASCFVPNAGVKTGADKNLDVLDDHHSPSSEENLQDGVKSTAGRDYRKDDTQADGCQSKLELPSGSGVRDGSSGHHSCSTGSDGSLGGRKSSSQLKTGSKYVEGECKLGARTYSSDPNHLKVLVSKSSSETYKSSASGSPSPRNVQSLTTSSKHRGILNDNLGNNRDAASSAGVKDEGRIERSKKITKDIPKSSTSPSVPNLRSSDPKQSSPHSSPKVMAPSATAVSGFGESTNSLKNAGASNAHNKVLGSGLPELNEKNSHPDFQPSSKVNASQKQPPTSSNPPAGLSDEELALLLHQELNSSPRVPRVPRTRHAASLPQLTSPTAASMLMKRTCSSGGKDFISSSRKKSKESGKDGAVSAQGVSDEAKKAERVSPSNHRRQYSEITINPLAKGEVESGTRKDLPRKNKPPASTATTSSGLSSSTEVNKYKVSSTRNSPRHTSDGDSGAVGRSTPLTLPGLIAKIMSKGERMTLKELCDAVLPHWPHLRKHNGERYAYSSHSHGVLDCLRNRSEWARLVDRGPKTSPSKKIRKPDDNPSGAESEDNDISERTAKDGRSQRFESRGEEFPKGKRKARKRRRLSLHGRGIKGFRRTRRAEVSDDGDDSLSNSSGDMKFSEDETQEDGTSDTNDDSASSDETEDL